MLSGQEIHELLAAGRLMVEPVVEDFQLGECSLDIRVGHSVLYGLSSGVPRNIRIGDAVQVKPGEHIRFVSLETIEVPDDISGIVFLWSGFASMGLMMQPTRISPGWRGKLVLGVINLSTYPVEIFSGQRVASISFFRLDSVYLGRNVARGVATNLDSMIDTGMLSPDLRFNTENQSFTRVFRTGEDAFLREAIQGITDRSRSRHGPGDVRLSSLFEQVFLEKDSQRKGELLEDFIEAIILQVKGLRIIKRNARLRAEELDFIVQNDTPNAFLRTLGSPLVFECKNWSKPVGAPEISLLAGKMEALSPDVRGGLLIATSGITGDDQHDAQLKRREYRQRGRYIAVLERADLQRLVGSSSFIQIIEEKFSELYLI